jgi:hypothetical protein
VLKMPELFEKEPRIPYLRKGKEGFHFTLQTSVVFRFGFVVRKTVHLFNFGGVFVCFARPLKL